jgi:hypothetical protein
MVSRKRRFGSFPVMYSRKAFSESVFGCTRVVILIHGNTIRKLFDALAPMGGKTAGIK